MTPSVPPRSRWPLAFFILNTFAIAAWFFLTGVFQPGTVTAQTFSPGGEELSADTIEYVEVIFDAPLDPSSVTPNSLRLHPPAAGITELVDKRKLRLRLTEKLHPATTYRLAWPDSLRGKNGQPVSQRLFTFATARPALVAAEQTGFDPGSYTLQLTFTLPVRAETLAASLSSRFGEDEPFRRDTGRVRIVTTGASRTHRLRIDAERTGWLVLRLDGALAADTGTLTLGKNVDLVLHMGGGQKTGEAPAWTGGGMVRTLSPVLTFRGMEPGWNEDGGVVTIRTSAPLDSAAVTGYVSVDPPVRFSCLSHHGGMKITGDFEPGRQYRITLRSGLPAGAAGELADTVTRTVWFDDRPASLDFAFGGGYLLPTGLLAVPVTTVNTDRFTVRMRRLYPENLVEVALRDADSRVEEDYAGREKQAIIRPANKRNEKVETLVNLKDFIEGEPAGIYGVEIRPPDSAWRRKTAMVVVSDIGLGARQGRDSLFAWTTSLNAGDALAGADITVYSNRRRFLATGTTGDDGTVKLALPALPDGERPLIVVATARGQTTFVHLDNHLNSRGADAQNGAPHAKTYHAFVAVDRGVYRGGETALASILVRDQDMAAAPPFPVEMALTSSDGKIFRTVTGLADANGRLTAELTLPRDSATGLFQVRAYLPGHGEELGRTELRVAEYMPETFRLAATLAENILPREPSRLSLQTERLAGGAPGRLRGKVIASYRPAPFLPKEWTGWTFGDSRVAGGDKTMERDITTDEAGAASAEWPNPVIETPAAVALSVRAEVREPGGRAVGDHVSATLHPSPFYLGLKTEEPQIRAGEDASFLLVAVTPDGKSVRPPSDWRAVLYRVEYNSLLRRRSDGRLIYDWQRREIPEQETAGSWGGGRARIAFSPLPAGSYRLAVESDTGKSGTLDFTVHGTGGGWSGTDPESLELKPARPAYAVGETAEMSVNAPFAGWALVTVETDTVLRHWTTRFVAGGNMVEIPVTEAMRPNAHVAVTLVRPVEAEKTWRPHRALGAAVLRVDNEDRRLKVDIDTTATAEPDSDAPVTVRVTNAGGETVANAAVVVWAVDEGVLSLTNYQTPSPWEYFYRTRRLSVADADMYSRLAPELSAWRLGREALPGGGDGPSEAARRLIPIQADRVRAAVVYRGDLTTDADGVATAIFAIPEIATSLRLMAWAASGPNMGAAEKKLEIIAPVSFTSSWPRFAAPGDEFQVTVSVLNRSGAEAETTLSASAEGGLELFPATQTLTVPDGESRQTTLTVNATAIGMARGIIQAEMGTNSFTQTTELAVRPPVLFQRRAGVEEVEPGAATRLVLADDLFPENGRVTVTAGGSPQIKLAGTLEYLVGYPYECAEQTASRLAALVALPDLLSLSRPGQLDPRDAEELARSCLNRLMELQSHSGGFRMWPGDGEAEFWLTAQIVYLLEECRERGWNIPESLLERARPYLADRLDRYMDILKSNPLHLERPAQRYANGEDAALACLALARGNALRRSWLVTLSDIAREREAAERPLASQAMAFLCHATLVAGDPAAAQQLFDRHGPDGDGSTVTSGSPFAHAAWLAAGLRLGVPRARLAVPAMRLERLLPESYMHRNTRENVWTLLALGTYWQRFRPHPGSTGRVTLKGRQHEFSLITGMHWPNLAPGTTLEAEALGEDSLHLVWSAEGVPVSGTVLEEDVGMKARRRIFTLGGDELNAPFTLRQGEVYRVRIQVEGEADDLVVADLLPAGLEVENPHLKGRDGESAVSLNIQRVERRDDRLLLFGAVAKSGTFDYLCRAVTPGSYVWPALDAGRMYDSATRSVHGENRLVVTGDNNYE